MGRSAGHLSCSSCNVLFEAIASAEASTAVLLMPSLRSSDKVKSLGRQAMREVTRLKNELVK